MSRVTEVVSALAIATTLAGCFHVTVPAAPPPTASASERIAAYSQLRAAGENTEVTAVVTRTYASVSVSSSLVLANGQTVRHADDLLPALDAETPAARAARRSGDARRSKHAWLWGGIAAMSAGLVMMVADAPGETYCGTNGSYDYCDTGGGAMFDLGLALGIVGALAGTVGPVYYGHVESQERQAAFTLYNESLLSSLDLCVSGMQVVPCDASAVTLAP